MLQIMLIWRPNASRRGLFRRQILQHPANDQSPGKTWTNNFPPETTSLVQIAGLDSGMDLNGHRGEILCRIHDTRRVTVKLPAGGQEITVKPENVEVLWTYDEIESKTTVFHE
ncbi:hypothetical protein IV203_021918 [Nitzschia inconspicua]|uniref:Uncharacterized protein n=1 Tax=Nitzschia inconspicua TaxID=303405 RepID=A0A9K3KHR6_9STRA|nr:hypothetical protein IV203_021918 [Nitzschia inconspicua]